MHKRSLFATLTYADEHLPGARPDDFRYPGDLDYRDFQLFAKRLRKAKGPFRHYTCGEYGERYWRPHFHSILFGVDFPDAYYWRMSSSGFRLYRSPALEKLWPYGQCEVGEVTFDSAAYVARYCMKKVTGEDAERHYQAVSEQTGEVYSLTPEFVHMSLKPGIGATWFEKYQSDVFPHDRVVVNGVECRVPRYYDILLARKDAAAIIPHKIARMDNALRFADNNTPERLAARERVLKAQLSTKVRNVE